MDKIRTLKMRHRDSIPDVQRSMSTVSADSAVSDETKAFFERFHAVRQSEPNSTEGNATWNRVRKTVQAAREASSKHVASAVVDLLSKRNEMKDTKALFNETFLPPVKGDEFATLYRALVAAVLQRVGAVKEGTTDAQVFTYMREVFKMDKSAHDALVEQERRHQRESGDAQHPVLHVDLVSASGVYPKDATGKSDPFCMLGVVPSSLPLDDVDTSNLDKSSTIDQNLNPVWNETFSFSLPEDPAGLSLFLEMWDEDEESVASLFLHNKLFKKFHKKSVTDNTQFLGRVVVPLSEITTDGIAREFELQKRSRKSHVSGTVFLKIRFVYERMTDVERLNKAVSSTTGSVTDTSQLFEYIVGEIVAHDSVAYIDPECTRVWDGQLSAPARFLLRMFALLNNVSPSTQATALLRHRVRFLTRFPLALDLHSALDSSEDGINAIRTSALTVAGQTIFHSTLSVLRVTLLEILRQYKLFYPSSDSLGQQRFSDLVGLLITLDAVPIMRKARGRLRDVESTSTLVEDVRLALLTCAGNTYRLMSAECERDTPDRTDATVAKLSRLASRIAKELKITHTVYSKAFLQLPGVDVFALEAVCFSNPLLDEVVNLTEQKKRSAVDPTLMTLYHTLRELDRDVWSLMSPVSRKEIVRSESYSERFSPFVMDFLTASASKTEEWIRRAIAEDKVVRVGQELHSSSVIDMFTAFHQTYTVLNNLDWPEPMMKHIFFVTFTQIVTTGVSMYGETIKETLNAKGFYDTEGQFDVTEELCVTLNNLETARSHLVELFDQVDGVAQVETVRKLPEFAHYESPMPLLLDETYESLRMILDQLVEVVVKKMSPDITGYLRAAITGDVEDDGASSSSSSLLHSLFTVRSRGHRLRTATMSSDDIHALIQPLLDYLDSNLSTLSENFFPNIFQAILSELWTGVLESMHTLLLPPCGGGDTESPFPAEAALAGTALKILYQFFYADGDGMKNAKLETELYASVCHLVELYAVKTPALVEMYWKEKNRVRNDESDATSKLGERSDAGLGTLVVGTRLAPMKERARIIVHLFSAHDLPVMDSNGLCDPYVIVSLLPSELIKCDQKKSKVVKKTLTPTFDQSLEFVVPIVHAHKVVVHLEMYDYDLFSGDDFIGEAIVPATLTPSKEEKLKPVSVFLAPSQRDNESKEASTLFGLLKQRSDAGDESAAAFVKTATRH